MARPYALLRTGFPYLKTIGMRRNTDYPVDVAIGRGGVVYVLSMQGIGSYGVVAITLDDEFLGSIRGPGKGGQFIWPFALVLDHEENLFVSDSATHRISAMTREGEPLDEWGEHGSGDGQLDRPAGIAFDADENLYVVDTMNHRVQKFTRDGAFLMKWGSFGRGEGQLNMPWGITVDELGDVYVADWRNDRVQKFSADGEFVFSLGKSGSKEGEFNHPAGVAVDSDGDIYVADALNNRVQLFSAEGRYVEQFIGDATLSKTMIEYMMPQATPLRLREMARLEPQKRLRQPRSVRVDGHGKMYIADYENFRVQLYQKLAIPLSPDQIAPPVGAPKLNTV